MILSDTSIRRPVLATVLNLLLILLGIIAYQRLTVREYPNIDTPVVTVETSYPGASAEIIETQVTKILEDSLSGIEGIEYINSISRAEKSQITVNFRIDRDADSAAADVRDRVGRVRGQLPDDVDEPIVAKVEADAQPVIWMALSSDMHTALEVSEIADRQVKNRIETLDGVANVRIAGERRYAMRVWLDKARLAAYNLTVQEVETALRNQNLEVPSGRVESVDREFTVLSETDLRTPSQFAAIILRDSSGYLVRLGDVARIEVGPEEERTIARFKGKNAVALGIVKQSTANPLALSKVVRAEIPRILETLPEGMQLQVAYDSAVFIDRSIQSVYHTIAEAVGLVILVIFVFLRSLRATLIPLVTIPVSLIGVFMMMYVLGYSINTLTLLALVLAIGLVVDDAIVMLENIHRHLEEGLNPFQAALKGSREIAFAVIAMTLTLAAVFTPMAFSTGRTGKLFTEFALTLAGAVMVSGFVALTLSPMMCSKLLHHEPRHSWLYNSIERVLNALNDGYRLLLRVALAGRWLVLLLALGVGFGSWVLLKQIKSELAPVEDRGTVFSIGLAPDGASIDYTDRYVKQMEAIVATIPEMQRYFAVVGFPVSTQALMFVGLKDWEDRSRKQQAIVAEVAPKLFGGVPGLMAFATNPPSLGQSFISKPVEIVIRSTGSYSELQGIINQVLAKVRENPRLVNVDTDLKLNKPQLRVSVDRDKVAAVGADVATVGRTLETMLGGRNVTRFKRGTDQYDVVVQVDKVDRRNPDDLKNIYVRGAGEQMIQLSNLIRVEESVAPRELNHFNKLRSVTISASLAPGYSQGEAIAFVEQAIAEVSDQVTLDYANQSREYKQSGATLAVTFVLALLFIYLVLAAQFESFIDPFIILFSVPLALAGALLTLWWVGGTLNIYSQIGMITLVGLITKHGILIVEFANQLQEQGYSKLDAVLESSVLRLRPILMTTGAMVLGSLPLAWAVGAGAESRQQIGWVIVGGMSFGTLFTLFVVPAVYSLLARRHQALDPETGLALPTHA